MMKTLKTLIGAAQRNDATADELAVSVRDAGAELQEARAALAHAQEAYQSGLLNPDDAYLRKLSDARAEAQIRVDRAEAIGTALAERQAVAIERQAQSDRLQKYEVARRQKAEVTEVLTTTYIQAAETIVEIMRALAEGEIAVAAANRELPAGMPEILGIEAALRNVPGSLPALVSEIEVDRWCYAGDGRADAIAQQLVEITEDGRGLLRHGRGGVEYLVKRRFTERRYSTFVPAIAPDRFAVSISLPGVYAGDRPFFAPLDKQGVSDPQAVLKALDRQLTVVASSAVPEERIEWKAIEPINAEAERRACATFADRIAGRV